MTTTLSGPTSSTLEIGLGYASGGRDAVKWRSAQSALDMLRRALARSPAPGNAPQPAG